MSLSMDERRALEMIEQHLCDDDPHLASVFHRFAAAARRRPAVTTSPTGEPVRVTATVSYRPRLTRPAVAGPWPAVTGWLRRAAPWLALVTGAAMLLGGIALPQLWLALAGAVTVAATPMLVPIGNGAARSGREGSPVFLRR